MTQVPKSTVKLPAERPPGVRTIFDFFVRRFPRIAEEEWRARFAGGKVFTAAGPLPAEAAYAPLLEVHYRREVAREHPVRTDYRVVFEDAELLVVDKPPFLPVTPGGAYVRNCLLNLLIEERGERELAPLHRLDKDTSGLVVFARRKATRALFAPLFRAPTRWLEKEYLALCEAAERPPTQRLRLEHHVARDPEVYHLQRVFPERAPNAVCEVELAEWRAGRALFRVWPLTGRKHQLRVQLAAAGFPAVGDRFYGAAPRRAPEELSDPLGLVCRRLTVRDFPCGAAGSLSAEWRSAFPPSPGSRV